MAQHIMGTPQQRKSAQYHNIYPKEVYGLAFSSPSSVSSKRRQDDMIMKKHDEKERFCFCFANKGKMRVVFAFVARQF
jgi:hypothetical protein